MNLTAFAEGIDARIWDDQNSRLSDNPYTIGTHSAEQWYRGYNYEQSEKPANDEGLEPPPAPAKLPYQRPRYGPGKCHDCGKPSAEGRSRCAVHLTTLAEAMADRRRNLHRV